MKNGQDTGLLKRLMPRGLYGRAALILFLPVVVVTMVVTVMFLQRHFEDVTRQMSESMVRELAFVEREIDNAPDGATAHAAGAAIAGPLGLGLTMPAPMREGDDRVFYDLSGRVVSEVLRARLPEVTAVDLSGLRDVTVTLRSQWGPYQVSFDRRRVSAKNPHQLLVLMLFTSLLMTLIAAIFLRNQLRPIRKLARAAEDYGRGRISPYRPAGATEVRSAGTAFLDMRNRLERQTEQRRLMLSGISHDLRTPLTRLKLGLEMLGPELPPDEDEVRAMAEDVEEMSHMVQAFLDFSRDTALDSPPQPTAALPFVEKIVADARRAGQEVTLGEMRGDPQGRATFRPDMLRRAVENLIGNAVRYGGTAQVEVALGPRSLRVSVDDAGPGIPEDRMEEAMRPFARLDAARQLTPGQGVGLGLAIAADVARAHGGQLRLERSPVLGGLRANIVIAR